ncbi:hypothetical protein ACH5RR_008986 [Cinchona calisaya]|uniref:MULE transposase domain-containing protein n=1 Tax=Cinchona calisaya TaxID=153742 RepID=A0ABD3AD46_9GENT
MRGKEWREKMGKGDRGGIGDMRRETEKKIQVNKESYFLNSNELNNTYSSLDEDVRQTSRMYICFEASKRGSREGCKRVVGVDGCHLRRPHLRVLLAVVGIDPNDCIYPITYAVVEKENKNSWKRFIEYLQYDLEIDDQQN